MSKLRVVVTAGCMSLVVLTAGCQSGSDQSTNTVENQTSETIVELASSSTSGPAVDSITSSTSETIVESTTLSTTSTTAATDSASDLSWQVADVVATGERSTRTLNVGENFWISDFGPPLGPGTLTVIDVESRWPIETIVMPGIPGELIEIDGSVWVAVEGDRDLLVVLDSETREILKEVVVESPVEHLLAVDGSVWVTHWAHGTVSVVDITSGDVTNSIKMGEPRDESLQFGPTASGLIRVDDTVWVANTGNSLVEVVDIAGEEVTEQIEVGRSPSTMLRVADSVWVASSGSISVVDVNSYATSAEIPVDDSPFRLLEVDESVWVSDSGEGDLYVIDVPSLQVIDVIPTGSYTWALAELNGTVFVANRELYPEVGRVDLFDSATRNQVGVITGGVHPIAIDVVDGDVWVTNHGYGRDGGEIPGGSVSVLELQ